MNPSYNHSRVRWTRIAFLVSFVASAFIVWYVVSQRRMNIVRLTHGDPVVQAAAREAQRTLPDFMDRLKHAKQGEKFAIDGQFGSPMGPEYLWAKNPKIEGNGFSAVLDQPPVAATHLHRGDTVIITRDKVYDWIIEDPSGAREGDFVARAKRGS